MSIKLRKNLIFAAAFLVAFILYWPSMKGTPIWDDFTFWFTDPVMGPELSYLTIWKNFGWPFSVSLQKWLLSVWKNNFIYYHLLNFFIHCANALLVYKLARLLRSKYAVWFFLIFLFHPIAVITTAWMIQIKTLLCFFFGLASILAFVKGNKTIWWMVFSWVLFALSITSKSASLTLPLVLLVVSFKNYRFSKLHLLIPFFILSGWGVYRVLNSSVTIEGSGKASEITEVKIEEPKPEAPKAVTPAPVVQPKVEAPKIEVPKKEEPKKETPKKQKKKKKQKVPKAVKTETVSPVPAPVVAPIVTKPEVKPEVKPEMKAEKKFKLLNIDLLLQTLHYYFWQTLTPVHNEPVKGLNYERAGVEQYVHIFFLIMITVVLWKDPAIIFLATAHFLLLPFLGIKPAPFMNVTWVSDQHLYLVIPAMIAFWLRLVEKLNWKYNSALLGLVLAFFMYKTYKATPVYRNQFTFYETSLAYNPMNVPIAYNLALARLAIGDINSCYNILENVIQLSNTEPLMKRNYFFPYVVELFYKVKPRSE